MKVVSGTCCREHYKASSLSLSYHHIYLSVSILSFLPHLVRVEDRLHDDKVHVPSEVIHLHPIHSVKVGQSGVGVLDKVLVVVRHDPPEELALRFCLCLDHIPSVVAVEEELPTLSVADELDEIVLPAYTEHEVCWLNAEHGADLGENLWGVGLELEGVGKLVGGSHVGATGVATWREDELVNLHEI